MTTNSTPAKSSKSRNTKATNDRAVAINVALPASVHRRLRVKAINDDMTLTQAVTAAVEQWTKAS
jgi:hypothetical protein